MGIRWGAPTRRRPKTAHQQDRRGDHGNHQGDREAGQQERKHTSRGQEEDRQDEGEQGEGEDS
jgi:hypothetical protein